MHEDMEDDRTPRSDATTEPAQAFTGHCTELHVRWSLMVPGAIEIGGIHVPPSVAASIATDLRWLLAHPPEPK